MQGARPLTVQEHLSVSDQTNHWAHYYRVLAEVLDDVRDGKLTVRWRAGLHAYARGLPRLWTVIPGSHDVPAPGLQRLNLGGRRAHPSQPHGR
jgi:hypothetical protein